MVIEVGVGIQLREETKLFILQNCVNLHSRFFTKVHSKSLIHCSNMPHHFHTVKKQLEGYLKRNLSTVHHTQVKNQSIHAESDERDKTGGPRYSRSFYLQFRLFEVKENILNCSIRGLSLAYSRFLVKYGTKFSLKCIEPYNAPSLFAVSIFAVFFRNVSTANYEGRMYCNIGLCLQSLDWSCPVSVPRSN